MSQADQEEENLRQFTSQSLNIYKNYSPPLNDPCKVHILVNSRKFDWDDSSGGDSLPRYVMKDKQKDRIRNCEF